MASTLPHLNQHRRISSELLPGSFGRAAENLHVTQTAVSARVKALEELPAATISRKVRARVMSIDVVAPNVLTAIILHSTCNKNRFTNLKRASTIPSSHHVCIDLAPKMKAGTTQAREGKSASAVPRTSEMTSKRVASPALASWVNRMLNALFSNVRDDTYVH